MSLPETGRPVILVNNLEHGFQFHNLFHRSDLSFWTGCKSNFFRDLLECL